MKRTYAFCFVAFTAGILITLVLSDLAARDRDRLFFNALRVSAYAAYLKELKEGRFGDAEYHIRKAADVKNDKESIHTLGLDWGFLYPISQENPGWWYVEYRYGLDAGEKGRIDAKDDAFYLQAYETLKEQRTRAAVAADACTQEAR